MGMSTHIEGFIPSTDSDFQRFKNVALACMQAKVTLPAEVSNYFNVRHEPLPGMFDDKLRVELQHGEHYIDWHDESSRGFEVDLTKLPQGVTKLRFYNNW
jgi:hypothetical protein